MRKAWVQFWFLAMDRPPLKVFRVLLGLLILVRLIAFAPNWERYFAADGILSLGSPYAIRPAFEEFSLFHWTEGLFPMRIWWWTGILAATGLTLGWRTRICACLSYGLQISMLHRNPWISSGGENLPLGMLLLCGCFAPLGDKQFSEEKSGVWAVRLMQVNIAMIYGFSMITKLVSDTAWRKGEAVYWVLSSNVWSRWNWAQTPLLHSRTGMLLCAALSYFTLAAEGLFPLLVGFRRTRPYGLAAVALLHLGILISLRYLAFFEITMLVALILFLPGDRSRGARTESAALSHSPCLHEA